MTPTPKEATEKSGSGLVLALVALLRGASPAVADIGEVVERWKCYEPIARFDNRKITSQPLVYLKICSGMETGEIVVSGTTSETRYRVYGFDRYWVWQFSEDESILFAFAISPDGEGLYYADSFSNAKHRFFCKQYR